MALAVFAPSHLEVEGRCGFRDRATHGLTEVQAKELVAKLRGIGPDLDGMRVRNAKVICYLKTPHEVQADQGGHERVHRKKRVSQWGVKALFHL